MQQKRVYNTLATLGQISIGVQGISCIVLAAALLITGGMFVGMKYERVPAVVDTVKCDTGSCRVGVTHTYNGIKYMGTFETMGSVKYMSGDAISIRVNPADPSTITEDVSWRSMGMGMMSAALALGFLAWYAIHLVSDDRNVAALAGALSVLRIAV